MPASEKRPDGARLALPLYLSTCFLTVLQKWVSAYRYESMTHLHGN